jgi:hypothetical protein
MSLSTNGPEIRVIERLGYRSPLAVRCEDGVTGAPVGDGLVAEAWRRVEPDVRFTAKRSPVSSIHFFGSLPRQWESTHTRVRPGEPLTWPAPNLEPYCLLVRDLNGRYLPTAMAIDVPVTAPVRVPLSSGPARQTGAATAVIRGEVRRDGTADPIAWALVRVATDTDTYQTVADERGRFRLHVPYPEALPALLGSPPAGPGLSAVTWPVTVSVLAEPDALVWSPGARGGEPPELSSITGQGAADLVDGGPPQPDLTETLRFGAALVLSLTAVPA